MNNDFKKAGYLAAIVIFILGVLSLVVSTAANYFSYDDMVVMTGELVSLLALMGLLIICITSKSNYNRACIKFAEYILNNRKKEAEQKSVEAERLKEIQNMKTAAAQERDNAVAAALEQGRTEGAQAVVHNMAQQQAAQMQHPGISAADSYPPAYQPYVQNIAPNEEILYNEYGEPVMIRRRVRRQRPPVGEVLYDRYGSPVMRRTEAASEASAQIQNTSPLPAQSSASAPAPAPTPAPASATSTSSVPNPASIPKPVANPIPTPTFSSVAVPKSTAAPAANTVPNPTPATITVQTHPQSSSAAQAQSSQSTSTSYQISWQSKPEDNTDENEGENKSNTPKPININPYKG